MNMRRNSDPKSRFFYPISWICVPIYNDIALCLPICKNIFLCLPLGIQIYDVIFLCLPISRIIIRVTSPIIRLLADQRAERSLYRIKSKHNTTPLSFLWNTKIQYISPWNILKSDLLHKTWIMTPLKSFYGLNTSGLTVKLWHCHHLSRTFID